MCNKIEINEEENSISIELSKENFNKLFKKDQYMSVESTEPDRTTLKVTHLMNQFVEFYCHEKDD